MDQRQWIIRILKRIKCLRIPSQRYVSFLKKGPYFLVILCQSFPNHSPLFFILLCSNTNVKLTMVLQPVKPTAVKPKIENNNTSLPPTTSLNNNNNTSTASSVAASQNPSTKPLITSTPSKNQQSAAQILANNTNNNSIQSPSTILPTPIAFSAVAKQNPGE